MIHHDFVLLAVGIVSLPIVFHKQKDPKKGNDLFKWVSNRSWSNNKSIILLFEPFQWSPITGEVAAVATVGRLYVSRSWFRICQMRFAMGAWVLSDLNSCQCCAGHCPFYIKRMAYRKWPCSHFNYLVFYYTRQILLKWCSEDPLVD
jgi:hypothetical protein